MARTVQIRNDRLLTTHLVNLPQPWWGNYDGPHTHDIPLAKVFDVYIGARPCALSFKAAGQVGRERVIDGPEWGFATWARQAPETGRRRCRR
jgi:hypothetical protein